MNTDPKPNEFCWTELATADVKGAKDFYGKTFGWTFSDHKMGDYTYTMIKVNGKEYGGIWPIPKDQQKNIPPHWINYILVENLEKEVEKVKKNGAAIVKPITQAGDLGRFAILQDPTGAHIALWQPLKKM